MAIDVRKIFYFFLICAAGEILQEKIIKRPVARFIQPFQTAGRFQQAVFCIDSLGKFHQRLPGDLITRKQLVYGILLAFLVFFKISGDTHPCIQILRRGIIHKFIQKKGKSEKAVSGGKTTQSLSSRILADNIIFLSSICRISVTRLVKSVMMAPYGAMVTDFCLIQGRKEMAGLRVVKAKEKRTWLTSETSTALRAKVFSLSSDVST